MKEIGVVGKGHENPDGYSYRAVDDVVAAVGPLLVKHQILMTPDVVSERFDEFVSEGGGAMFRVWVKARHTFTHVDGSSVSATTIGEGMDTGDKSSGKAQSVAMKYALTEVFQIATREAGKDVEEESPAVQPRERAKRVPKTVTRDINLLGAALEAAFPNSRPGRHSWLVSNGAGTADSPYCHFAQWAPDQRTKLIGDAKMISNDRELEEAFARPASDEGVERLEAETGAA
jgi:hypothetical protein